MSIRRTLMISATLAFAASTATAQTLTPLNPPARPIEILSAPAPQAPARPSSTVTISVPAPAQTSRDTLTYPSSQVPDYPHSQPVPYSSLTGAPVGDHPTVETALIQARRGDASGVRATMQALTDPVARKIALWAMVDADGEALSFSEVDQARRDLAGWPRPSRRQTVAERALDTSGLGPAQVIAWFDGAEPTSPQGAMALATAYQQSGRTADAQALIRRWWRTQLFEADAQRAMLTRFGSYLTTDDHIQRLDTLLYGAQGPAVHDMLSLVPADVRAAAEARMALRSNARDAMELAEAIPPSSTGDPGLAVERARYLHEHDMDGSALALVDRFPQTMPCDEAASRVWVLRKQLINAALKTGDYRAAYALSAGSGLIAGADYTEAEFYAGWLALSKLHQPALADAHFANIERASSTPISQARALYWRGRAAEAQGDQVQAMTFYGEGARHYTTFYGQLAAEKAGVRQMTLGRDPVPSAADISRFEARDAVRAARMLSGMDEHDLFRAFVLAIADGLPDATEYALLVDLARNGGDQDLAMRVVRTAAQHGVILPERGYPLRTPPVVAGSAEPAMVFGVTRQESGFDPRVRSGVGARGMMQIMPGTAVALARKLGEPYYPAMLDDPDYNMRLGAFYIGNLISTFNGSYLMATAAYNAGPGRPAEWAAYCGDPRATSVDPADFIECIPFSETRNYVMRVLEAAEVYRARLNGGTAPIRLSADLKRGGYVYSAASAAPVPVLAATPAANADQ